MSHFSNFLISQLLIASVLKEKFARMKRGRRNNWFTKRALSYDWLVCVPNNVLQFIERIYFISSFYQLSRFFLFYHCNSSYTVRPISSGSKLYLRYCLRAYYASNAGLLFELVALEITVAYMRPRSKN